MERERGEKNPKPKPVKGKVTLSQQSLESCLVVKVELPLALVLGRASWPQKRKRK